MKPEMWPLDDFALQSCLGVVFDLPASPNPTSAPTTSYVALFSLHSHY